MHIVVLGGGRVGATMARDLAAEEGFDVTLVDASQGALDPFSDGPVGTLRADLSQRRDLARAVSGADLVVGAVPGPMGFDTVRAVIEEGRSIVDISFFEEDAFELDGLARERGVTVLVDCGVAPGASNLILGHMEAELARTDRFACYVGGLPRERVWPWEYKAPFSPIDVIAEYTRPARLREHGRTVVRPALSRPERLDFDGVGSLEAFETDGLRTLLHTSEVPELVEKTLRYPGHRDRVEALSAAGFFSEEPVVLRDGTSVRPLDLTAHLLFSQWRLRDEDDELTVMRVEVDGVASEGDAIVRHTFDMLDRRDPETGASSMARTTGFTCTAMARLVARGLYREPGVSPPEVVGRNRECFDRVFADLEARGVLFRRSQRSL